MYNPFYRPTFIVLDLDEDGRFVIRITNIQANAEIVCGTAFVAAALLQANRVRFFDYGNDLSNKATPMYEFLAAAKSIGFDV